MQFNSPVAVRSAFSRNQALVVAVSPGVTGTDGSGQAYRGITHIRFATGIILRNQGKVRIRSLYCFFLFFSLFVFYLFFLFCLICLLTHRDTGCRFCNSLCFVGSYAKAKRYIGAMGFGVGHIRPFFADNRLGKDCIPQQAVVISHSNVGHGVCLRIALHHGNAQRGHAGTAGLCLNDRRINSFQPYCVSGKGIAGNAGAFCHCNGRRTLIVSLTGIDYNRGAAYTDACGLGRNPARAFRLQIDIGRSLFRNFMAFAVGNFPGLTGCCRQLAAAFYSDKIIRYVRIVRNADRDTQNACRYADHIRFAPGVISRFNRQVAVCSC